MRRDDDDLSIEKPARRQGHRGRPAFIHEKVRSIGQRARDVFSRALAEFDDTCMRHDAEMDGIRAELLAKFGKVPVLETYRQMAIRRQRSRDPLASARAASPAGPALHGGQPCACH